LMENTSGCLSPSKMVHRSCIGTINGAFKGKSMGHGAKDIENEQQKPPSGDSIVARDEVKRNPA
jgi:hypothetical protein